MEQPGPSPMSGINARDYRYVMSLARRYNAIVFWHRDRNGFDWQPLLMPLAGRPRRRAVSDPDGGVQP